MKQFTASDAWRIKIVAGWACLAPVGAMALVISLGGGGTTTQFVVDSHALALRTSPAYGDRPADLPAGVAVDGSVATEAKSQIAVPVTGTTDGQPVVPVAPVAEGNPSGIPGTVLAAYQKAANELAATGCGITWPLLAGIGKVESSHASGGRVDANGLTRGRILGPVLDGGPGMAAIADTDQGRFDGDARWDRAVGPMQFIPGTWNAFGADGNGDGVKDPHNVFDAARAAGDYLCSGGANLKDPQGLVQAVLRYNHSMDYVSTVLRWMQTYSTSAVTIPDTEGTIAPPINNTQGNVEPGPDPTAAVPSKPTPTTPFPPQPKPQPTKPPWTIPTSPQKPPTTKPTPPPVVPTPTITVRPTPTAPTTPIDPTTPADPTTPPVDPTPPTPTDTPTEPPTPPDPPAVPTPG